MSRADTELPPDRSFVSRSFETWTRVASNIPRSAALSMVGPALLIVFGYIFWVKVGAGSLDRTFYGLKAENITLTHTPAYIRSDITKQVYVGSHLDRISLLDREACSSIALAYSSHPWIARVLRVQKMAGSQVKVDVEYRRPLAWVYREQPIAKSANDAAPKLEKLYYPVDYEGVNLPHADFAKEDIGRYLQIFCPDVPEPTGPIGSTFNDPRIIKALRVCAAVADFKHELGIERVNVRTETTTRGLINWTFELQLTDGRRVPWGHAPGEEINGEAKPVDKLADLRRQLTTQLVSEGVATPAN